MENNLQGTNKGFSLVELAVALVILGIMASVMVISPNVAKQTAKHEAERLQEYIYRQMQKSDRIHKSFTMKVQRVSGKDRILINWRDISKEDSEDATAGCSYEGHFEGEECTYNPYNRRFQFGGKDTGGHITVTDADGEKHYIYIASGTSGRIRLTDKEE